jgi:CelD/BcsL family acetyltransferase involved in cellulose biosynthesis/RimJ/RimL family protein N-acetyltransferase
MIEVIKGADAKAFLQREDILASWLALWQECAHSTVFQHPDFILPWLETYAGRGELLVICDRIDDSLNGMALLWRPHGRSELRVAGTIHAEYQDFLARDDQYAAFFLNVIEKLTSAVPGHTLLLRYLTHPETHALVKILEARNYILSTEHHFRPIMDTADGSQFRSSLSKKSNKSRISRMSKLGPVAFRELTVEQSLDRFSDIAANTDFRQAATHEGKPFSDDPLKEVFHRAILQKTDIAHSSALMVGDEIAAYQLALRSKNSLILWLVSHNPFFAQHSPGKFHILHLGEQLAKDKLAYYDLTPGGDGWKERFSNRHVAAWAVTIRLSPNALKQTVARAKTGALTLLKSSVRKAGIRKHHAHLVRSFISKLSPGNILANLRARLWSDTTLIIYEMNLPTDITNANAPDIRVNTVSDLLGFDSSQFHKDDTEFFASCMKRLENGEHVYSIARNNKLVHFGWMIYGQERGHMSEVGQHLDYPEKSVILYDFYTHPAARGEGLYGKNLRKMLKDISARGGFKKAIITVKADNIASRKVIERTGFRPYLRMTRQVRFGRVMTARHDVQAGETPD